MGIQNTPLLRGLRGIPNSAISASSARDDERGIALLVVLMSTTLLMALGAGLVLLSTTEARIAAHFGAGLEALYGAEAAIERVLPDLSAAGDWAAVAAGDVQSTFRDGEPSLVRTGADGVPIDLFAATHIERCGRPLACGDDEASLPWRLYAHAPISDLLPSGRTTSRVYLIVWAAEPGSGSADTLILRARAYGLYGARRTVEAVIIRAGAGVRLLSWREL